MRSEEPAYSFRLRVVMAAICLGVALFLLAGAWTLPFFYESSSILYKFGYHKWLLRGGKLVGLTVGLGLFFQIVAVSRLAVLERIFARPHLVRFHRLNGLILALILIVHPVLILGADDFAFYPLAKKYVPEFVGVLLFFLLMVLVLTAFYRMRLHLQYQRWLTLHRLGAVPVLTLFFVHLLFVSETFHSGLPRFLALGLAGMEALLLVKISGRLFFPGK